MWAGDNSHFYPIGPIAGMREIDDLFWGAGRIEDVRTWAPTISSSSNGDISFFIRLYRELEEMKSLDDGKGLIVAEGQKRPDRRKCLKNLEELVARFDDSEFDF